ncbi:MAG: hypothetical protein KDK66_08600, partial [Deltaproteobacteria bacterium]|nr:hypothetical protein [Deltaproteobacteria bacterium]
MSNPMNTNYIQRQTIVRQATGGLDLNRPTAGAKFMGFLRTFGSTFLKIGSAVTSFFPFGKIASPLLGGFGQMVDRSAANSLARRDQEMTMREQTMAMGMQDLSQFALPGLEGNLGSQGEVPGISFRQERIEAATYRGQATDEQINGLI